MGQKVLIPQDVNELGKNQLLERGYELKILYDSSPESICLNIEDCDAVLGRYGKYPRCVFEAGKNLKIFAKHGVGVDDIDLEAAKEFGITVTNTPEANMNSVAEHTVGMMLACAQNMVQQDSRTRAGEFQSVRIEPTLELAGKKLGLIGFGNIARSVAKKAALGLDMKVIVYNHRITNDLPEYVRQVSFEELLRDSDVVSLHCPLNRETRGMINEETLGMLKPTAVLLNFARGGIIDENALYKALVENKIFMAGLDCFSNEPTTADNPLFKLKNIIVSPHSGGLSQRAAENMSLHAAMCIDDVLSGRKPKWVVKI